MIDKTQIELVKKYSPLFTYAIRNNMWYGIRKSVIEDLLRGAYTREVMSELIINSVLKPYGSSWAINTDVKDYLRAHKNDFIPIEEDPLADAKTSVTALIDIYKPLFDYIKNNRQKFIGRREAHEVLKDTDNVPKDLMEELTMCGLLRKHNSTWAITDIAFTAIGMETKTKSLKKQISEGYITPEKKIKPTDVKELTKQILSEMDNIPDVKVNRKKKVPAKRMPNQYAVNWKEQYYDTNKKFQKYLRTQIPGFSLDDLLYEDGPNDFVANGKYASAYTEYNRIHENKKGMVK